MKFLSKIAAALRTLWPIKRPGTTGHRMPDAAPATMRRARMVVVENHRKKLSKHRGYCRGAFGGCSVAARKDRVAQRMAGLGFAT